MFRTLCHIKFNVYTKHRQFFIPGTEVCVSLTVLVVLRWRLSFRNGLEKNVRKCHKQSSIFLLKALVEIFSFPVKYFPG